MKVDFQLEFKLSKCSSVYLGGQLYIMSALGLHLCFVLSYYCCMVVVWFGDNVLVSVKFLYLAHINHLPVG